MKEKGLFYVLRDITKNLKCYEILLCFSISVFISSISFSIGTNKNILDETIKMTINIFPSLTGFTIACYTIILTLLGNKQNIRPLLENDQEGKVPYHVLCSTFAFTILLQLLSIIFAFTLGLLTFNNCKNIVSFCLLLISLFSLILSCNIVLHLFSLRTLISRGE